MKNKKPYLNIDSHLPEVDQQYILIGRRMDIEDSTFDQAIQWGINNVKEKFDVLTWEMYSVKDPENNRLLGFEIVLKNSNASYDIIDKYCKLIAEGIMKMGFSCSYPMVIPSEMLGKFQLPTDDIYVEHSFHPFEIE